MGTIMKVYNKDGAKGNYTNILKKPQAENGDPSYTEIELMIAALVVCMMRQMVTKED